MTRQREEIRMRGALRASRVALGAALGLALAAAKPASIEDTTTVVAVEIPVQVVDGGRPVRGLTRNQFEVYVGRQRQALTGFEVVDLVSVAEPAAQPQVSAASRRHFLFLFDLAFSDPGSVVKAREAAQDILARLHASDLAAVATYNAAKGPQLLLGFSSDRRQVQTALLSLGQPALIDQRQDPLRLMIGELKGSPPAGGGGRAELRTDLVFEELELQARQSERVDRMTQEAKVRALTRSLADLGRLMAAVEGRKHVVYLSEGIDSSLLVGAQSHEEQEEMASTAAAGDVASIDSDQRFGSSASTNALQAMVEEFRRADCTIQSVDISRLRAGGEAVARRGSGLDSLVMMAKDTGGEVYQNFNDLGEAMGQMLDRTSVTYVLAFQPQDLKLDGAFHRLRVELKGGPRGARVVHRPGFYAPRPAAQQSSMERLFDAGAALMDAPGGAFSLAALAAPFYDGGETSYVPVLLEIDGRSFAAGVEGQALPTEIYVYALAADGAIADFVTQTVGLDLAKVGQALQQSGVKFFGHLDLVPGDYTLRALVRNGSTGATALQVVPLHVPAVGAPALLPALFHEPVGKWLMVREAQAAGEAQPPYPFISRQQAFVPASRPVLAAGQAAAMSLVGYNLGEGDLRAKAVVVDANGAETAAGLELLEREPGTPERIAATLLPPPLAPGEYRLRVTLTSSAGQTESSLAVVVR
jgi:VWFA-related protein